MKKIIAVLLLLTIIFTFAACGDGKTSDTAAVTDQTNPAEKNADTTAGTEETKSVEKNTVTVYVPENISILSPTGTKYGPAAYEYEDGWQEKDSFTVTYSMEMEGMDLDYEMVYGDKCISTVAKMGQQVIKTEIYYDENGQPIRSISYPGITNEDKTETVTTLDEKGRTVKQETNVYTADRKDPSTMVTLYTFQDTADGSIGTATAGNQVTRMNYDQEGKLISVVNLIDGQELTRTEYTYDENGNVTSTTDYYMGQQTTKTETTYKAVELSAEKAQQLPQFKAEN